MIRTGIEAGWCNIDEAEKKASVPEQGPGLQDEYDPRLLLPVPRATHRRKSDRRVLTFSGVDIWNAYELSWLDPGGKPRWR